MGRGPFRLGDWLIEPAIDEIARDGERIKVEPRTMAVLLVLAERAPDVLSQDEIERAVWGDVVVTPHSVYQSVAQLRKLLRDDPKSPRYIATVPRKGYRLVARVEPAGPPRAAQVLPPTSTEPSPIAKPSAATLFAPGRRWWVVSAALAFAVVILAVLRFANLAPFGSAAHEGPENSIAVLPLKDVSPEGNAGPFADGIAAELVNALSQTAELRVAGTTSSFSLRNDPRPLPDLGRVLGVRHLVEGTVSRMGERVRVSVRLVDADSGFQQWSETYDRPFADILQVQDDLARSIAGALKVLLVRRPGVGLSERRPQSLTAYELYLLGSQSYMARTPQALGEAAAYFQRAIDADPEFAPAYAGLADTYVAEYYFANRPLDETRALATPLLEKALALDVRLAPAHALVGLLKLESGEFDAAERDLTHAVELNVNYPRTYLWLGMARHEQLRFEEALTSFNRAIDLDPLIFIPYIWRGLTFDSLGRTALGQQDMERAATVAPRHPNPRFSLALNAVARGALREAAQGYARASELDPQRSELLQNLALIELDLGEQQSARQHLTDAATLARSGALHLNHLIWLALVEEDRKRLGVLARDLRALGANDPFVLVDAGFFLGLAGASDEAVEVYDTVARMRNGERALYPIWALRWGMEYHALHYATYLRSARQVDAADRALLDLERFLDRAEQNGFKHWGVVYLRAGIAAQRGESAIALQFLEQARALGWRRPWWARHDPALAPLRDQPQFAQVLARATPG